VVVLVVVLVVAVERITRQEEEMGLVEQQVVVAVAVAMKCQSALPWNQRNIQPSPFTQKAPIAA